MLVPCRNCGKDIGEVVEKCLHCGTLVPNRKIKLRGIIFIVSSTIMGIIFVINYVWYENTFPQPKWFEIFFILFECTYFIVAAWYLYKEIADQFK